MNKPIHPTLNLFFFDDFFFWKYFTGKQHSSSSSCHSWSNKWQISEGDRKRGRARDRWRSKPTGRKLLCFRSVVIDNFYQFSSLKHNHMIKAYCFGFVVSLFSIAFLLIICQVFLYAVFSIPCFLLLFILVCLVFDFIFTFPIVFYDCVIILYLFFESAVNHHVTHQYTINFFVRQLQSHLSWSLLMQKIITYVVILIEKISVWQVLSLPFPCLSHAATLNLISLFLNDNALNPLRCFWGFVYTLFCTILVF